MSDVLVSASKMDLNWWGIRRGLTCPDCSVLVERGAVRCSYCGCPLANHQPGKNTVFKIITESNKNSAEVDIAPAFGEITTACNVGQAKNGSWCLLEE